MRRAVLFVPFAALVLAGCGAGDESAVSVPSTSTAASSATIASRSVPAPAGEAAYVAQLQASGIIPRYGDAQGAVELGKSICQDYDAGKSHADVISVLTGDGMTDADAGMTNAAAIVAFCPAFGQQI